MTDIAKQPNKEIESMYHFNNITCKATFMQRIFQIGQYKKQCVLK